MTKKRKPYKKGLKADYKGASAKQVAAAVLRYRHAPKPPRVSAGSKRRQP